MTDPEPSADVVVGLFIGGASRRMGGQAKGMLPAPGGSETVSARLIRIVQDTLPRASIVLVGKHSNYDSLQLPSLTDRPPGIGPLGGLLALLHHTLAQATEPGSPAVALALACDMPYVSHELLHRLNDESPDAAALAPCVDGRYQPFFARYKASLALRAAESCQAKQLHSLQHVLRSLDTEALSLDESETLQLRDWDRPEDVQGPS